MASPSQINEFIEVESRLRRSLNDIFAFNPNITENNPNVSTALNQLLNKLEIIKNSINDIPKILLDDFIELLQESLKQIDDIRFYSGKEYKLDNEGINRIIAITSLLLKNTNDVWELVFNDNRRSDYDKLINDLTSRLNSFIHERDSIAKELSELKKKSTSDANTIAELKHTMEIELKEFDERYKKNLGDYELLSQEKIFREAALDNHFEGKQWIWYIVGLTAILLFVSTWFMYSCWLDFTCLFTKKSIGNFYNTEKWQVLFYYELFKPVVIRVFILSVIILLLKFALKNYNALMHNKTVNMHKANSLAAMIRVINSLSDENTRTTLINLAGKEIFLHQKTGYLRKDDNKIDLSIIEKLASILQKKE